MRFNDVAVFADETRAETTATFHGLRQQISKGSNGKPNFSISDFCAPEGDYPNFSISDFCAPEGDYVGGFCVTAGLGEEERSAQFWRRPHRRTLCRHSSCAGLSRTARPHGKGDFVPLAECYRGNRCYLDPKFRDASRQFSVGYIFQPP